MTSNDQGNKHHVTINPDLIQHSEYDIELLDNSDITFAKDVNKLVINPTYTQNIIAFKKNKDTLLTIPLRDIDKIVVTANTEHDIKKEKEKEKESLPIQVTFSDNTMQSM